jgi:serine/threonine protein kinase/tetratricopeptide (TPR) repeat protein
MTAPADSGRGASLAARFAAIREAEGPPSDALAFLEDHPTASPAECLDILLADQRTRADLGSPIPIEHYLQACPGVAADPALKLGLVFGEILHQSRRGRSPDLESYVTRFPDLREALTHQSLVDRQILVDDGSAGFDLATRADPDIPAASAAQSETIFRLGSLTRSGSGESPLGDRFSIRRQLGAGGMGVVYQAYDRQRHQMVALKMMRCVDPAALYRFKQEFRSLAGLTHPNLAMLHELVADGDQWCFTMELVDGTDFLEYVRSTGPAHGGYTTVAPAAEEPAPTPGASSTAFGPGPDRPSPPSSFDADRLRRSMVQLADGLNALHASGWVHRDLKPSNVMVTRRGRVVILDFGLVAELKRTGGYQSTEHHVVGTICYMAPEQAGAGAVTPASDWYSVGVMLYQALTGRLPFSGTPVEVMIAKQREDPRPPVEPDPSIPEDLLALALELLARDPASRPSGDDVARRLAGGLVGPEVAAQTPKRSSTVPLVGRAGHLEALREAFAEVERGLTGVVCVHGRSGAGKSTLVQHFLQGLADRDGVVILSGRCYEQESVPYKALDSLIDALSRYLTRLPVHQVEALLPRDVHPLTRVFPVLQRVAAIASAPRSMADPPDPNELRRRAFAALRELLARLGDRRPLILAIDDLHWGDADSAVLLSELFRPPNSPVMLAIASFRDEDAATNPFLRNLLGWCGAEGTALRWRDIKVEQLTVAEACSLAQVLLGRDGSASTEHAEMIARESVGNPLFVHELVESLRAGGPAGPESPGLIALDQVLSARIGRLPDDARHVLEFVAVAGRPIRLDLAIRDASSFGDARAALAVLRSGRLVRIMGGEDTEEIETYHDRVREVAVERLSPADRQAHHLRLAQALESGGDADAEYLADHFHGGGDPERAGHYYEVAAAQASDALAFDRATKLYRLALSIRSGEGAERSTLLVHLGDALANAGRGAEASREYLLAAQDKSDEEARELRRRAAMQLLVSGHVDEGLSLLRGALEASGMKLPGSSARSLISLLFFRLLLRLRGIGFVRRDDAQIPRQVLEKIDTCWSAAAGLSLIDPIVGLSYQTRCALLALRAGEPHRIIRALAFEAGHRAAGGGFTRRQTSRFFRHAEALATADARPADLGFLWLNRAMASYLEGGWRDAVRLCNQADKILRDRCTGVAWALAILDTFGLWALISLGEIGELARHRAIKLRLARERGDLFVEINFCTYIMSIAILGEDRPDLAQEELDRARALWTPAGFLLQHHNVVLAQCHIHLYNGDGPSAWSFLDDRWPSYRKSMLLRVQQIRIDVTQLRARSAVARAVRDPQAARLLRLAERDAGRLGREKMAWADAHAQAIRAMAASARGDLDSARTRLADAARRYDEVDMGLYAATARRRLGQLVGGDEGRGLVAQADSWMLAHGVKNPTSFTNMYMPGLPAEGPHPR